MWPPRGGRRLRIRGGAFLSIVAISRVPFSPHSVLPVALQEPTVVTVPTEASVAKVSAGRDHSCALTADGSLYTFGAGEFGQLGLGSASTEYSPKQAPITMHMPMLAACWETDRIE